MISYQDAHLTKQCGGNQWDIFLTPVEYPAVLKVRLPIAKDGITPGELDVCTRISEQLNEAWKLQEKFEKLREVCKNLRLQDSQLQKLLSDK